MWVLLLAPETVLLTILPYSEFEAGIWDRSAVASLVPIRYAVTTLDLAPGLFSDFLEGGKH